MIDHDQQIAAPNSTNFDRLLKNINQLGEQSWHLLDLYWHQYADGDDFSIPDKSVVARAFAQLMVQLLADPARLLQAQATFHQDLMELWQTTIQRLQGETSLTSSPCSSADPADRRFQDSVWSDHPGFDFIKKSYLLATRSILDTVRSTPGLDSKTAQKIDFYLRQYLDAVAPTNFVLSNPQVLTETLESQGENLLKGLQQMRQDFIRRERGTYPQLTDTSAFKLGYDIATTPGQVVYQTSLMQLIQYQPLTEAVFKRPLLIVPPWINKYYILDLKPENSFIRWAVEQGFSVFVISWVNPDESLAQCDFEDYLSEGILAALTAIKLATGISEVNAIGYCLGGTLLMCTLAYLQARGEARRIKSATLLTTLVDFSEAGELSVFIDDEQITLIERHMQQQGYLSGQRIASVFNMLRANDLIWSAYINNYLLGKTPPVLDLLYWNSDTTRMPCAMQSFYLRNMYLNNKLREPGGIQLCGQPIDLKTIAIPLYFLATREDHIAPWQGVYKGALLATGSVKFVLAGSGHIAGVINPARSTKYGYRTGHQLADNAQTWLAHAKSNEGSWWPDWLRWIKRRAGKPVIARTPGDGALNIIEAAPGSYAKVRFDSC